MIERLNFFDLYGYLIPGLTLVALALAPFVVVGAFEPTLDLGSALGWSVLGYVVGHWLHGMARESFPAGRFDASLRLDIRDSEDVLDRARSKLDRVTLERVQGRILSEFGLDVSDTADPAELSRRRQQAFFLCRNWLIRRKLQGYAEQFEGMYSLMRNVAAACTLGAAGALGWFVGGFLRGIPARPRNAVGLLGVLFVLVVLLLSNVLTRGPFPTLKRRWIARRALWWIAAACFLAGSVVGSRVFTLPWQRALFLVLFAFLGLVASQCHAQFRFFSRQFSETVYRDFLGSQGDPPAKREA